MSDSARYWLDKIRALPRPGAMRIMNVCGGHERTITMSGLRGVLPADIELIPGPGCPVCVCPEEDVHLAIQLALQQDVILLVFGDMLRVPVNVPKSEARTLDQARALGADVRPIASPRDAVRIALDNPERSIVFFAAGFETTIAPVAAMLLEGVPYNLSVLLSGRRTWPAVSMLLESESPGFDALIAPGHVATVMGMEEWRFVTERHGLPAAVAGFTPASLLAAIYSVLRQKAEGRLFLDNCYPEVVRSEGNVAAQQQLQQVMRLETANWRGIGSMPASGYALREAFSQHDARLKYPQLEMDRRRAGEMPTGCDCAKVVLGKISPDQCRLYGHACTPRKPVGPCMVSDEGACRIWWSGSLLKEQSAQSTAS